MQGFCDQIARQYDALVTQAQVESTSFEDFLSPVPTNVSHGDGWLDFAEFKDATAAVTKGG
jgi:hypothetical protein